VQSVVLALLEHPQSAIPTLAASSIVAGLIGHARVNALAIRISPQSTIMPTEEILTTRMAALIRAEEAARVDELHRLFNEWQASMPHPVDAAWTEIEGYADALTGEWGRRSDYLVLNQLECHDHIPFRLIRHAALFDTGRPVLVVPPDFNGGFGECVAIAWRDDARTQRAVLDALRLLAKVKQVHVLAGKRDHAPAPVLPEVFAEHGIDAQLHILRITGEVFGQTLLDACHLLGADMLVMGAFTHNRWYDLILGGVTKYMLAHSDLPVLMRH